jgi:hypothetical protein
MYNRLKAEKICSLPTHKLFHIHQILQYEAVTNLRFMTEQLNTLFSHSSPPEQIKPLTQKRMHVFPECNMIF